MITLALGFVALVGLYAQYQHTLNREPVEQVYNDGMIYTDPEPVTDPWDPQFPVTCLHPAWCDPGIDSICTIIWVARHEGTSNADIVTMLRDSGQYTEPAAFYSCMDYWRFSSWTDGVEGL